MIKYIIIDDEYIAHTIIERYCDLLPNLKLVKNCYDAIEALEFLQTNQVDLIFLDLNMPQLKGFEFLRTLQSPPKVIVTTAYKEYALEGYELNISDYLLKPFSFERFLKAINKSQLASNNNQSKIAPEKETLRQSVFIRNNKRYTQVSLDDILYMESSGNYVKMITTKEEITTREKISDLLLTLNSDNFIQVHKSYAVSSQHIQSIEGNRIFIEEHIIPIGKLYKMKVTELFK